jgi:hypothetical protein
MKSLLAIIAVLIVAPAQATLFCYDEQSATGFEWNAGQFYETKYDPHTGWLQLDVDQKSYCWANGPELGYIESHFSGLPLRINKAMDGNPTVYWTGESAEFLLDNL